MLVIKSQPIGIKDGKMVTPSTKLVAMIQLLTPSISIGAVLVFDNAEGLTQEYLPHEAHKSFVESSGAIVAGKQIHCCSRNPSQYQASSDIIIFDIERK